MMTAGSMVRMDDMAPPDDLVTIQRGAAQTGLTWAQINYAVNKRYLRAWTLGIKRTRHVSLAELRAYERQMKEFRPLGGSDDEGTKREA